MTEKLTREQAVAKMTDLVKEAYAKINEAEAVADEYGLSFNFETTYGAGATYYGEADRPDWVLRHAREYGQEPDEFDGWIASSTTC